MNRPLCLPTATESINIVRNIITISKYLVSGVKSSQIVLLIKQKENLGLCLYCDRANFLMMKQMTNYIILCISVSPDGLLLQSSTVADSASFQFSEGITESIPCSYIEFAERLILPQFKNLPDDKVYFVRLTACCFPYYYYYPKPRTQTHMYVM